MNLNTTPLIPHSDDLLESARHNWHYLLSGLVLPVICVVSLAENALAIVVLLRVRPGRGIGATSRAYYMLLAAADIGSLLSCQLGKQFAEFAMNYLTGGRLYFSLPHKKDWTCRTARSLQLFFPHLLNWTYALLNFERLFAVHQPLISRRIFTVRTNLVMVAVVCAVGALFCVYFGGFFIVLSEGPQTVCSLDRTRSDWIAFVAGLSLDIYVGPNVLSLALAVALLVRLCAVRRTRERLFNEPKRNVKIPIGAVDLPHKLPSSESSNARLDSSQPQPQAQMKIPRVAVGGALTAVLMALMHVLLTQPAGALMVANYVGLKWGASPEVREALFKATHVAISLMSVGSLVDFFIYYWRIVAFREALATTWSRSKYSSHS